MATKLLTARVEISSSYKHVCNHYDAKKFYSTGPKVGIHIISQLKLLVNYIMFAPFLKQFFTVSTPSLTIFTR